MKTTKQKPKTRSFNHKIFYWFNHGKRTNKEQLLSIKVMVLILDGNSEIGAQACSEIGILI